MLNFSLYKSNIKTKQIVLVWDVGKHPQRPPPSPCLPVQGDYSLQMSNPRKGNNLTRLAAEVGGEPAACEPAALRGISLHAVLLCASPLGL